MRIALAILSLILLSPAHAQDALVNWRGARQVIDRDFADDLQELVVWCRSQGLQQQAEQTFDRYRQRDLQRMYLYPPGEATMPEPDESETGQWQQKLNEVHRAQGQRIFELAQRAAEANAGGEAFRLLNEVLYFDPDHAEVRRMLKHRRVDEGWRVASDKISVRTGRDAHKAFGWPAQSYLVVRTPFFEIVSNASEERTVVLAEKLERWHAIWRQVFFDYWSSAKVIQRWFDGKSSVNYPRRRFSVAFFRDHQQYVNILSRYVRGVDASTGYYDSRQQMSFFPDGDDPRTEDTWRHELTHQLFRESVRTKGEPFEQQFIWLDEGIAAWFESLADFGSYATVGGFDSRRMQYARIRLFHEKFYIPLQELTELGREGLQQHPDMIRIYAQAAAVSDMLMNDDMGAMSQSVCEFMRLIYAGKLKPGSFEELIGKSFAQLDSRYPQYLIAPSQQVENFLSQPQSRTELSLPSAELTVNAMKAIGECHHLTWLDLSRNVVDGNHVRPLENCKSLSQLFMIGCRVEPSTFEAMQRLPELDELELSVSSFGDEHAEAVAGLNSVTVVRAAATRIGDAGLAKLTKMPNLKTLDVSKSQVTTGGAQYFRQQRPEVTLTWE